MRCRRKHALRAPQTNKHMHTCTHTCTRVVQRPLMRLLPCVSGALSAAQMQEAFQRAAFALEVLSCQVPALGAVPREEGECTTRAACCPLCTVGDSRSCRPRTHADTHTHTHITHTPSRRWASYRVLLRPLQAAISSCAGNNVSETACSSPPMTEML